MALLLTYIQQKEIKPIGGLNNANQVAIGKYDLLAEEVESLELDKLLNSPLYQDVSANPLSYEDLLDGSEFKSCNDTTINHRGLRYVLAYLNYAQWSKESHVNDTSTGFTQKTRPDSELMSKGDRDNLYNHNREIAFNAWKLTEAYLNQADIDLWNPKQSKRIKKPTFRGLNNFE